MRDVARRAFLAGTWLVGAAVLIQVLLAGLGVFTYPGFFFWHASVNASVVFLLPLVLLLVGWLGRVPVRILGLAAAVTGLTIVQSLLLIPYHMNMQDPLRVISSLHALNAIFIFWVALQLVAQTSDWIKVASDR